MECVGVKCTFRVCCKRIFSVINAAIITEINIEYYMAKSVSHAVYQPKSRVDTACDTDFDMTCSLIHIF